MKLLAFTKHASMAISRCLRPALSTTIRSSSSSSTSSDAVKWEGGISMVQGCSRGIGLEFVKQLLQKSEKGHVIATCRKPNEASGLLSLKNMFAQRLSILPMDVTDESTIEASAKSIRDRYGSLNLLVNASGILSIPDVLQPETTLLKVEKSSLLLTYEINAVGPILVIKHMWPLLKAGGGTGTDRDVAVVANISARVGSIGDNRLGGWHSYRSSKAALNQLTKTVSVEFARRKDPVICILLHPGTVDTDLSKPFQRNVPEGKLFTKEYSVQKLLGIIDHAKIQDNGKFFAWDGQEIPWSSLFCIANLPLCCRRGALLYSSVVATLQFTDLLFASPLEETWVARPRAFYYQNISSVLVRSGSSFINAAVLTAGAASVGRCHGKASQGTYEEREKYGAYNYSELLGFDRVYVFIFPLFRFYQPPQSIPLELDSSKPVMVENGCDDPTAILGSVGAQ
ncbi:hypothetical protein ACJRO7_017859 [Eucalyptus globulus]|uniref:Uncharacterized protein n=1 Tax=Eucalyptus globulus TaxID=34317 RepID=A0ABD3KW15_EUCGL